MESKCIQTVLNLKYPFKEEYSKEELMNIESLNINRFTLSGEIEKIDFNELLLLENLSELNISKFIIDYNIMQIICSLTNLKFLVFSSCEFIDDISSLLQNLNLDTLVIDDCNFNFSWFKFLKLKNLILSNIKIETEIFIDLERLDVRKSNIINFVFLKNNNIMELIISKTQYDDNVEFYDSYKNKVIVMEDNGEFIFKEVN